MKILRNEDGVALITALMFTLICLGMIMTLLYYVLLNTKITAAQKQYKNAISAAYGGTEVVTKAIIPVLFSDYSTGKLALRQDFGTATLNLEYGQTDDVIKRKLNNATADWGIVGTSGQRHSVNPKEQPDFIFTLKGGSSGDFKVYSKIVDTVPGVGLIDASGIDYLDGGIGVAGSSSSTTTLRTPQIYSIEVRGERSVKPKENAGLSVLYAY